MHNETHMFGKETYIIRTNTNVEKSPVKETRTRVDNRPIEEGNMENTQALHRKPRTHLRDTYVKRDPYVWKRDTGSTT